MKRLLVAAAVCVLLGTALTALGDKPAGEGGQWIYVSSRTGDTDVYLANVDGSGEAMNLTNKAGMSMTNEAGISLTNKASASQTVDGGGMLTVKGGLVKIN